MEETSVIGPKTMFQVHDTDLCKMKKDYVHDVDTHKLASSRVAGFGIQMLQTMASINNQGSIN